MTLDEFAEYKYIIENALDLVKFSDRVNIVHSGLRGQDAGDTICVFSRRSRDIAVAIVPRGPELNIMYFDCGFKNDADVLNLATPDSVQTLGELIKNHLRAKYGRSQSKTNLG